MQDREKNNDVRQIYNLHKAPFKPWRFENRTEGYKERNENDVTIVMKILRERCRNIETSQSNSNLPHASRSTEQSQQLIRSGLASQMLLSGSIWMPFGTSMMGGPPLPPPPPPPAANSNVLPSIDKIIPKSKYMGIFDFQTIPLFTDCRKYIMEKSLKRDIGTKKNQKQSVNNENQTDNPLQINEGKKAISLKDRDEKFQEIKKVEDKAIQFSKTIKILVLVIYKMTSLNEEEYETGDLFETVYELIISVKKKIGNVNDWEMICNYLFGIENRYEYKFKKHKEFPEKDKYIDVKCEDSFISQLSDDKLIFNKKEILNCKFSARRRLKKNESESELTINLKHKDVIIKNNSYHELQAVEVNDAFDVKENLDNYVKKYSFHDLVQGVRTELSNTESIFESTPENYCLDIVWPDKIENKLKEVYDVKMQKLVPGYNSTLEWINEQRLKISAYELESCQRRQLAIFRVWDALDKRR
jgi:hypothetical protein